MARTSAQPIIVTLIAPKIINIRNRTVGCVHRAERIFRTIFKKN